MDAVAWRLLRENVCPEFPGSYRISQDFDSEYDVSRFRSSTAYKRVAQKVRPSDKPDPMLGAAGGGSVA